MVNKREATFRMILYGHLRGIVHGTCTQNGYVSLNCLGRNMFMAAHVCFHWTELCYIDLDQM